MENQPHSPVGNLERTSKASLGHARRITGTKNGPRADWGPGRVSRWKLTMKCYPNREGTRVSLS